MRISKKIIYPELSYKITGVLFAVHNELGRFYNERQYCDAIERFFKDAGVKYTREVVLPPSFENELKGRNRADFIVESRVIIEIKTKRFLEKEDYYQTLRYLKAYNKKLAILVNFRDKFIKPKRIINSTAYE